MEKIIPYKMFVGSFIPNWLMECRDLNQGAKLAYARLCQYAGKDGKCYPKKTTIANNLGVQKSMAWKYIKELINYGLIIENDGCFEFLRHDLMDDKVSYSEPDFHSSKPKFPIGNPLYIRESLKESIKSVANAESPKPDSKIATEIINYLFHTYKQKHNVELKLKRGRYIKQIRDQFSELTFESAKPCVDEFISGGGSDPTKFIWKLPELLHKHKPMPPAPRDPRLDMTPEERLRADGWYD